MRFDFSRKQPYEGKEFLSMLQEEVRERNARLEHPFVRLLFDGKLTLDQVRGWAKQDFALKKCPTWWNAGRLLNSPSLDIQRQVARSLIEELGEEGGGHTDMYLRFGSALGIAEGDMENAPLLPSTVLVVDELMSINRHRPVLEALASGSVAGEAINVDFCTNFIKANDAVYDIPREGLEWFYEHVEADAGHSSFGERLVAEYADTLEVQERVVDAVVRSKAAYWVFFEGVYQAYVLNDVEAYPHYRLGGELPARYPFGQ
ncbi:MAG: iron-containing redox enzyme family protein [Dehalococcoidia bacterium]